MTPKQKFKQARNRVLQSSLCDRVAYSDAEISYQLRVAYERSRNMTDSYLSAALYALEQRF